MKYKIDFKNYLKKFEALDYVLNKGITEDVVFQHYYSFMTGFESLPEVFSSQIKNPFSAVYLHLGYHIGSNSFVTNNCTWWDLEYFDVHDGKIDFELFMKRMGVISRSELFFDKIHCYDKTGNDDKYIDFEVNGKKMQWHLGEGIPDSYIQRFAILCEELKTKGKYTIYDDGSQAFVLDFGTDKDLLKFNTITGLNRRYLKDTNHFSKPVD